MTDERRGELGQALGWVAILLAIGLATALNMITFAVLYVAVFGSSDVPGGLSENATQVLTGWGGGIVGILGAFVGYRLGATSRSSVPGTDEEAFDG
ncbi:MAG TPA: hypothetical protein VKB54_06880 [Solirubrobacteraceae bacterium]|nr:hypothetical protein [Solirubrobacteraceae bacterium]